MNSAALPKEKASEPEEEARQPSVETKMLCNQPKKLTFAKNVDLTEKPPSQISSSYKIVLSQPPLELSHSERLIWLQKRRTAGLWVQCDECDRWRYLPNVLDRHELPKKWYCRMNTDPEFASCSVPEAPLRLHDEEDLIHSEYAAGSLVWARLGGWPWWPAMVDDCPDTEQYYWLDGFSDIPTHYNVVFFDAVEVTRAWIAPEQLKPYSSNREMTKLLLKNKKYYNRLKAAIAQANEAEKVSLEIRLARFSFIARHKGKVMSPKKPEKKDLKRYQKQLKKKFNVDFPIESSDSDDDTVENIKAMQKNNNNVIILGTPKKRARKENKCSKIIDQSVEENNLPGDINIQEQNNTETQNSTNVESFCNGNKPSNSMIVQIGSTEADSIDNDTSATYVPESATEQLNLTIRMDTPNSDDFDF